jgi:hypothetical protein
MRAPPPHDRRSRGRAEGRSGTEPSDLGGEVVTAVAAERGRHVVADRIDLIWFHLLVMRAGGAVGRRPTRCTVGTEGVGVSSLIDMRDLKRERAPCGSPVGHAPEIAPPTCSQPRPPARVSTSQSPDLAAASHVHIRRLGAGVGAPGRPHRGLWQRWARSRDRIAHLLE